MKVTNNIPQTLKLIQVSSDCVLQMISLIIAKKIKKKTHLYISLFQPISSNLSEPLKNTLRKFLLNFSFPINNPIANKILITVGFKYINIGLLKKIVSPQKIDIRIAPTNGI